jgi:type III secretion protein U
MADENEQKALPPSSKKLRDARRKGQVSHSRDFISGFTLTIMLVYLWLAMPALGDRLSELVDIISNSVDLPFAEAGSRDLILSAEVLLRVSLPLAAVVVIGGVLAGVASTLGPVFSFELVKPKFEHINPMDGFKRIFSVRNFVEFARSTAKVVALGTAFLLVLRGAVGPLFEMPVCGAQCIAMAAMQTAMPFAITAAIAFMVVGLLDLLVQRRLFLRDMRMTRTESKREHKELEGDPLIRGQLRSLREQAASGLTGRVGISRAVIGIMHGNQVIGLRYKAGETPGPLVVCKADGEAGAAMLAELQRRRIPIVDSAEFAAALSTKHKVGDLIHRDLFPAAARALHGAGLV